MRGLGWASHVRRPGVDMSTIDAQGNVHDRAGLFAQKQNSAPAGGLAPAIGRDLSGEDLRDIDSELAEAAARAERDAAKAAKQAAAAEKAITSPDGTPLRAPGQYGDTIRTLVSAERELTHVLADYIAHDGERSSNQKWASKQRRWADALIAAIAAKKGLAADAVRKEGRAKAFAKLKREGWS